jgi:hypothetical protein
MPIGAAANYHNQPVTDHDSGRTFAAADLPPSTADLRTPAVTASDRINRNDSEWRELRAETDDFDTALEAAAEGRATRT